MTVTHSRLIRDTTLVQFSGTCRTGHPFDFILEALCFSILRRKLYPPGLLKTPFEDRCNLVEWDPPAKGGRQINGVLSKLLFQLLALLIVQTLQELHHPQVIRSEQH